MRLRRGFSATPEAFGDHANGRGGDVFNMSATGRIRCGEPDGVSRILALPIHWSRITWDRPAKHSASHIHK